MEWWRGTPVVLMVAVWACTPVGPGGTSSSSSSSGGVSSSSSSAMSGTSLANSSSRVAGSSSLQAASSGVALSLVITSPVAGAVLDGTVDVHVAVEGQVSAVRLRVDGVEVAASSAGAPWVLRWDTTLSAEGPRVLVAEAEGAERVLSQPVTLVVDRVLPTVLAPMAGQALRASAGVDVRFSKDVVSATVTGSTLLLKQAGVAVDAAVEVVTPRQVTVTPVAPLQVGADTELVVNGVADAAGHTMDVVVPLEVPAWFRTALDCDAVSGPVRVGESTLVACGTAQAWGVMSRTAQAAWEDMGVPFNGATRVVPVEVAGMPGAWVLADGRLSAWAWEGAAWVVRGAAVEGVTWVEDAGAGGAAWAVAWGGTGVRVVAWGEEGPTAVAATWMEPPDTSVVGASMNGPLLGTGGTAQRWNAAMATWDVLPPLPGLDGLDAQVVALAEGGDGAVVAVVSHRGVARAWHLEGATWSAISNVLNLDPSHAVVSVDLVPHGDDWSVAWEELDTDGWHVRVAERVEGAWRYPGPDVAVLGASGGARAMRAQDGAWTVTASDGAAAAIHESNAAQVLPILKRGPATGVCVFPEDPADAAFPRTLSMTGCYADASTQRLAEGVVPYSVNAELFSDGEDKRRYLWLPAGTAATFSSSGPLGFPDDTVLIKEFRVRLRPGQPTSARILETRFMIKRGGNTWDGYSYRWRDDGSDADLVPATGDTITVPLERGDMHVHGFPGRGDCLACHTSASRRTLGLRADQLRRPHAYAEGTDDQLRTWARSGWLAGYVEAEVPPPLAHPADPALPVDLRARAYLDSNCSGCHRVDGPNVAWDARAAVPLAESGMCGSMRVVPGDPAASTLHARMVQLEPMGMLNPMPPLGRTTVDAQGTDLVSRWISSMGTCP